LRIQRVLGQDPLEHDPLLEALETTRLREVDLGHSTHGQAADQLVLTQTFALGKKLRELLHRPSSYSLFRVSRSEACCATSGRDPIRARAGNYPGFSRSCFTALRPRRRPSRKPLFSLENIG